MAKGVVFARHTGIGESQNMLLPLCLIGGVMSVLKAILDLAWSEYADAIGWCAIGIVLVAMPGMPPSRTGFRRFQLCLAIVAVLGLFAALLLELPGLLVNWNSG